MSNFLRVVSIEKFIEHGFKYYQICIGQLKFPFPWQYRLSKRKLRTHTEAEQYGKRMMEKVLKQEKNYDHKHTAG